MCCSDQETTHDHRQHAAQTQRFARQPGQGAEPSNVTATGGETEVVPPSATPKTSKSDKVLVLLRREDGATLAEIVEATGWLPHSARAALTGLRKKKGHAIEKTKRGEVTCYAIKADA